ncbi:hypothetical protein HLI_13405 [Halobacillus litoralis]|uniref:Uncharacterized protein n=1 Tax=Halobacillus litoralis TaxID=45668 RepID=A0A410MEF2_9BACI|nr:hypothetical protein HLI_13405 [Halobacillus litoralis]
MTRFPWERSELPRKANRFPKPLFHTKVSESCLLDNYPCVEEFTTLNAPQRLLKTIQKEQLLSVALILEK